VNADTQRATEPQGANIYVVRSVWRRLKKGHIEIRDLDPRKDVKGGGGATRDRAALFRVSPPCS
jgi:hypothetical protein